MSSFLLTESGLILTTESGEQFILEDTGSPQGIQFISKSRGASSWSWEFGDGTTSTLENPRHLYPASGAWVASLTASSDSGLQATTQRAIITLPCMVLPEYPLLIVTVNGQQLGYGALVINEAFWDTSVDNPIYFTLFNFGRADLVIEALSMPVIYTSKPTNPDWFKLTPPAFPLTIPPGGNYAFTVLSTPNDATNQLAEATGQLRIVSNDFVHPSWNGDLFVQCRWYAEFYTTIPDLLIGGVPYYLQTDFNWAMGTKITVIGDGAYPPYSVGQCPPCSGDMVFRFDLATLIQYPATVEFGDYFLEDTVGTWEMSARTFDELYGGNSPQTVLVTCKRSSAFNKTKWTVPSNLRQDGLPWTLSLFCDWRVATAVNWNIVGWPNEYQTWTDGVTLDIDIPPGAGWSCTPLITSLNGPVHPDTTTVVFTPTHTEPGSTGNWVFATASMSSNSDTAPSVYNYPFRIFAPFLADNVIPQTANLSITVRKNDCTYETRTVHLRFFAESGGGFTPPSVISRFGSGQVPNLLTPDPNDLVFATGTGLGPGPTPVMDSGTGLDLYFSASYGFSVGLNVTGTGPFTYVWKGRNTTGATAWTVLPGLGAYTGYNTATLVAGTPGALNPGGAYLYHQCVVTGPGGSISVEPIPALLVDDF